MKCMRKVRTYRSNIGKASDRAMRIHEGCREDEVDEPSQDQERCIGVQTWVL